MSCQSSCIFPTCLPDHRTLSCAARNPHNTWRGTRNRASVPSCNVLQDLTHNSVDFGISASSGSMTSSLGWVLVTLLLTSV